MDLQERINLGIKFLDDVKPGWAGEIDTDELDMENPHACVLGQLYRREADEDYPDAPFSGYTIGGYRLHDWLVKNGIYTDEEIGAAQELAGFERLGVYEDIQSNDTYAVMQDFWHGEIVGRQIAASARV